MATTPISQLQKYVNLVRRFPRRKRILCLGDSWFQYPLRSYGDLQTGVSSRLAGVAECLDDSYPGRDADEVPGMAGRWRGIATDLADRLDRPFDLVLVSIGGNDVIGKDFAVNLKTLHAPSPSIAWPWSPTIPQVARDHIRFDNLKLAFDRIDASYRLLRSLRDDCAPNATIIGHTYADVTPMNRAYQFLGMRAGPWMWQPMLDVGLVAPARQRELSRWLLASFAGLLGNLAGERPGFFVLDTRLELEPAGAWDNEIHPNRQGFTHLVTQHWMPAVRRALRLPP